MQQTPKETARFKIDITGSRWSFDAFAVYERSFGMWWRVHSDSNLEGCEVFVRTALRTPVYYG